MKKSTTSFFRRYNSLIVATFSLVFVVSSGLFYIQFRARYQNEKEQLETKFLEEATSLDYLLEGGRNQLTTLQIAAESYLTIHPEPENSSLLFSQLKDLSETGYYGLDQLDAPFTPDLVANLTGEGSLNTLSDDVQREIEMALSLNSLFQAAKENIPNFAWVYYTSKQNFISLYPWVSSADFKFHQELHTQDFYTFGLPENNPERQLLWTHAYTDTAGKGLMVTATAPIYDGDRFLGTVALDLTLDVLNTFIRSFKTQDIDQTHVFVVNQYNELLAHPTLVSSADTEVKSGHIALPETLQDQLEQVLDTPVNQITSVDGYLILHHSLNNAPWQLVLWVPQQEMILAVLAQTDWLFLLLLPGLGLTLVVFNQLTKREFIIPAQKLVDHIEAELRGNAFIPSHLPPSWQPWFTKVSHIFEENRTLLKQLEAYTQELETKNTTLKATETLLAKSNRNLEEQVEERTHQLKQVITQLELEIGDRKQITKDLQASKQLFQLVCDTLPQRIFWKDQDFNYLGCNAYFAQDAGLESPEQIIGKSDFELSWKDSAHLYRADDTDVIKNGITRINYEEPQIKEDGTILWLRTSKIPLHDDAGNIIGIFGSYEDITEHKQTEETFRETKVFLQSIIDNVPVGIFVKEAENLSFVAWNKAEEDLTGFPADVVLGKSDRDFFPAEQAEFFVANDREVLNSRHLLDIPEEPIETAHRGQRLLHTQKLPILDAEGNPRYLLGISEDITERKLAEQQLRQSESNLRQKAEELEDALKELQRTQLQMLQSEKMSSLGQLVAGVAHEINNPVNFIHGNLMHVQNYAQDLLNFINLYQKHYPNPITEIQLQAEEIDLEFLQNDLPQILSSMAIGTNRIRQIVLSLRTFSRMDEAEFKAVNVHEGIDSTLLILQHRLKAKSERPEIQVIRDYSDLPQVKCYAGQLNQVFMNILVNAIDALEDQHAKQNHQHRQHHPGQITIRTTVIDARWIEIAIADNGPGIPEAIRQRIFDPFFTTKPVGKGTGMGMSISYQIITEKHNGKLKCCSFPGQGTEFTIQIPIWQ